MSIPTTVHGIYSRRTLTLGAEESRVELETADGVYLGTVVYVRRRHRNGGSTYGWRPEKAAPNSRLTDKGAAIRAVVGDTDKGMGCNDA